LLVGITLEPAANDMTQNRLGEDEIVRRFKSEVQQGSIDGMAE